MFNIFKKHPLVAATLQRKTTNEIIQEIHDTFYTEADRLLAEAKIQPEFESKKIELIEKSQRLARLGFSNTKECKEAKEELDALHKHNQQNISKKDLVDTINYFSTKYPLYKFITEDSVQKICAKYGLVYSGISKYIGTVPDKNLREMESFKIEKKDKCESLNEPIVGRDKKGDRVVFGIKQKHYSAESNYGAHYHCSYKNEYVTSGFEIAAPLKDFNQEDMILDKKTNKLRNFVEVPDPIVLQPVIFNNQKHYLIVTAWGLEASDELVVNEKMN